MDHIEAAAVIAQDVAEELPMIGEDNVVLWLLSLPKPHEHSTFPGSFLFFPRDGEGLFVFGDDEGRPSLSV